MTHSLPLLILGCSATKKVVNGPTPFLDVYDGPIWQQVRSAKYPRDKVAVLSAEHGLLEPGTAIENYDRVMTEDRLVEFVNDPVMMQRFVDLVDKHGSAIVVGGELYKLFSLGLAAMRPRLIGKVRFVLGSYLQQRHGLKVLLDNLPGRTISRSTQEKDNDHQHQINGTGSGPGNSDRHSLAVR